MTQTDVKGMDTVNMHEDQATDDDDEDVILEGTPLHSYLNDLDSLNVSEVGGSLSQIRSTYHEKYVHDLNGFWFGASIKDYLRWQWQRFRLRCSHVFPVSQNVLIGMSRYYLMNYGKEILESKVMLEDDLDYLCLQTPQQFLNSKKSDKKSFSLWQAESDVSDRYTRYSPLGVVVLAYTLSLCFSPVAPSFMHVIFGLATCFILFFNLRIEIIIKMWKLQHEGNLKMLKQFLLCSEKLNSVMRRSIRLVQEIEVVSRGYKLVNGKTPIARLEQSDLHVERAFLKLRLTVLRSAVKCTVACRNATLKLQDYNLEDIDVNGVDKYSLCSIPLNELGPCFVEETSSSELYRVTDGYCLAVLRSLNSLLNQQTSEMFTRLSLTLSGSTWDFTPKGILTSFTSLLSEPYRCTMDCLTSLQHCYDVHKHVTDVKHEHDVDTKQHTGKSQDKNSAMKINVHSLQVHMRAAMYSAMDLEEKLCANNTIYSDDTSDSDRLNNIKMHLDASVECWEACVKATEDVKKTLPQRLNAAGDSEDVASPSSENDQIVLLDEDSDTGMEDQVFEATSEAHCEEENRSADVDETSSKKIFEESATVIRELRSVLAVKTSEKQREMWKRQLFPYRALKETKREDDVHNEKDIPDVAQGEDDVRSDLKTPEVEIESVFSKEGEQCAGEDANDAIPQTLRVPKKVALPGRPPSMRSHKHKRGSRNYPTEQANGSTIFHKPVGTSDAVKVPLVHQNGKSCNGTESDLSNSVNAAESEKEEWADGLCLGFSNDVALQAVLLARKRSAKVANGNEVVLTYGDD